MRSIIKSVFDKKLSHEEAGILHKVNSRLVQSLVSGYKKDPDFLEPARQRELKRRLKLRAVITQSQRLLNRKEGLLKAQQVKEAVMEESGISISS